MKHSRRRFLHLAAGAAALPIASRIAWGQTYPTRPITLVVPIAAGGAVDTAARIIAEKLQMTLHQPVGGESVRRRLRHRHQFRREGGSRRIHPAAHGTRRGAGEVAEPDGALRRDRRFPADCDGRNVTPDAVRAPFGVLSRCPGIDRLRQRQLENCRSGRQASGHRITLRRHG